MNIGDLVKLKSGGPVMVVSLPASAVDSKVEVTWMSRDGLLQRNRILPSLLKPTTINDEGII